MWSVIVCDRNQPELNQLAGYIRRYFEEQNMNGQLVVCSDWPELAEKLKQREADIILMALDGVEGLDTITSLRLPSGKIVWFSDLNFSIQAYRLCVTYFSRKPVTYRKLERAFARCMEGENVSGEDRIIEKGAVH